MAPRKTRRKSRVRIPISRSGFLSSHGYKNIVNSSTRKRRMALRRAIKSGKDTRKKMRSLIGELNAKSIVTKNTNPEFSKRVKEDQVWISGLLKKENKKEIL
jgi:hypothetical protein